MYGWLKSTRAARPRRTGTSCVVSLLCVAATTLGSAACAVDARHIEGISAGGASYAIDVPSAWNHKVLLYSHGYRTAKAGNAAQDAPRTGADALLKQGYALVGSSFRSQGWALAVAPDDGLAALDEFERRFGKPKRVIAWGDSMGGLVTLALIEEHPERIDGAVPMCGSVVGTLGMMNQALDASFALKMLVDPDGELALTGPGANDPVKVQALLDKAQSSGEGRARVVLAGVLAQIPTDSQPGVPPPAADDVDAIERVFRAALANGAFFPRDDQQQRAGGNGSWNVGVDYAQQLELTGRRDLVAMAYHSAGLDLDRDLATLNAAPRITADKGAVAYLRAHFAPSGKLRRPVLSLHTTGDGMTMASYESSYRDYTRAARTSELLRQAFVHRPGHCTYTSEESAAAVSVLDARIESGVWNSRPLADLLNDEARRAGANDPQFVAFEPQAALRPCRGGEKCVGAP